MNTAILVDGAFYLYRAKAIWGNLAPAEAAEKLYQYCWSHFKKSQKDNKECDLYRIFYYDCPPADINAMNPITKENIHTKHSNSAKWRLAFFDELKKHRKLALRLGSIDEKNPQWKLDNKTLKLLCDGRLSYKDLKETDVKLDIRQKGVDMRIGLDIASISFKKQASQIILIAGDSDFVPAAKLARREGIDFILDPLWLPIKDSLFEHIDGLRSMVKRPCEDDN